MGRPGEGGDGSNDAGADNAGCSGAYGNGLAKGYDPAKEQRVLNPAPRPRLERGTYCLGGSRSIR